MLTFYFITPTFIAVDNNVRQGKTISFKSQSYWHPLYAIIDWTTFAPIIITVSSEVTGSQETTSVEEVISDHKHRHRAQETTSVEAVIGDHKQKHKRLHKRLLRAYSRGCGRRKRFIECMEECTKHYTVEVCLRHGHWYCGGLTILMYVMWCDVCVCVCVSRICTYVYVYLFMVNV